MANKLFLVCAALSLCVLLANASIYRTIVEFDEDEVTNPTRSIQRCQKEFRQAQHLSSCRQWMHNQIQRRPGGLELEDLEEDDDFFYSGQGSQQRPPVLQQCCNELQQVEPMCVCPSLKFATRQVRSSPGQHEPYQVRKLYNTAKKLPNICDIQGVGVCPFRRTPFYY